MRLLLAGALLTAGMARPALAGDDGERAFQLVQRLNCRAEAGAVMDSVPKNSVLLVFDEESAFGEPFKWVVREKAALRRAVGELLEHYGMPLAVREMDRNAARSAFQSGGHGDIALDYRSNSFAVRVTESCRTVGSTTVFPLCDENDGCFEGDEVYGPDERHYAADSCVQSVGSLGGQDGQSPARLRAYLAAIIVHEVVHAAHARLLGNVMASPPSPTPRECPVWVSLADAQARTKALRAKLGIPYSALHMAHGLMTPGISLDGDPSWHAGGNSPNLAECLADKRLPSSLFADMGGLASSSALCTDYNKPLKEFFSIPAENLRLIGLHLKSRLAVPCHAACYYRLSKAKMRLDR